MLQALLGMVGKAAGRGTAGKAAGRASTGAMANRPLPGQPGAPRIVVPSSKKRPAAAKPPAGDAHGRSWGDRAGKVLDRAWAMDIIAGRLDSMFPQFVEAVTIRVYGQRWATIEDLYTLGMCLLVSAVDGRHWWGDQHIKCVIDRTGKTVEIEFIQSKQGTVDNFSSLAEPYGQNAEAINAGVADLLAQLPALVSPETTAAVLAEINRQIDLQMTAGIGATPFKKFHNPDWLHNEFTTLTQQQVRRRIPDILEPTQFRIGAEGVMNPGLVDAFYNKDAPLALLVDTGGWTANRVANQPFTHLVTHTTAVNPAPQFDGISRGTDLTAIVTQLLQDPLGDVPVPETDRPWEVAVVPQHGLDWGLMPDAGGREGAYRSWWKERPQVAARWIWGWVAGLFGLLSRARPGWEEGESFDSGD